MQFYIWWWKIDVLLFCWQRSEELEVVREAIESLRSCFRPHDPHHHTLDTLEQVLVRTFLSVTSFLSLMLELWRIHFINLLSQLFQIFCCLSAHCRLTGSLYFRQNLSANRRPTVGRLSADSWPTVSRQVFWGALLHNYQDLVDVEMCVAKCS